VKSDVKILSFTLLIIILIILSGILIRYYLHTSTEMFNKEIASVQLGIETKDWNRAEYYINKIDNDWKISQNTWALFINHHEIDNISISLRNAVNYINYKSRDDSTAYLSVLQHYFDHIPDIERLSLKNIL
jgi:hypothetical protein